MGASFQKDPLDSIFVWFNGKILLLLATFKIKKTFINIKKWNLIVFWCQTVKKSLLIVNKKISDIGFQTAVFPKDQFLKLIIEGEKKVYWPKSRLLVKSTQICLIFLKIFISRLFYVVRISIWLDQSFGSFYQHPYFEAANFFPHPLLCEIWEIIKNPKKT